ncbi:2Fe-2S iron-sulfur cluster-binding protein [Paraburkholderia unamae]|uniref:2Fe-2S iron-sulfur cluster protein n=1 Tax=Paraburkholderia unamae TaxID=219649 RepID=A0ABX5KT45_9BURK|nr:2Fe-2S iron-sulfur cluster-binding protein [Paraburkholderia unamae]PVX86289.1 2Fe-2S iron-sulfur cluster protein [Paraburkholderia unamae]CAG9264109.1 2Fe-2S iron-sulfur cluster binding domain-containing protein [Paraburkholderia unamae]
MSELVTLSVDGRNVSVAAGTSVAAAITVAALAQHAPLVTRRSVSGALRGPLCGMGICQECRVTIDGTPHRLACQSVCAEGMHIVTGNTAP